MFTPKEQLLFDHLNTLPNFKLMVDKLQLEPSTSPAFKHSTIISARVSELISAFKSAPPKPMFILKEITPAADPWDRSSEINNYLTHLYGQQPWPSPLPSAPF